MIGRTYWKSVALPSKPFGAKVIPLTESEIKRLQVIKNGVYRRILEGTKICTKLYLLCEEG